MFYIFGRLVNEIRELWEQVFHGDIFIQSVTVFWIIMQLPFLGTSRLLLSTLEDLRLCHVVNIYHFIFVKSRLVQVRVSRY